MCGIVGMWNLNGQLLDSVVLERFSDSLVHRGPDGGGIYLDDEIEMGFGHRRLAILDIGESGHQPMTYGNGRYCITFNGEIYNFLELRAELVKLGHCFRTESDTEVVLAAYAEWGQDCQLRFNGMWAFAIWDSSERHLFLSRDRFGVKPLYFIVGSECFLFASELKAFMALPGALRPEFDLGMIARVKNDESIDRTLLQGVQNLHAGCCLSVSSDGVPRVRKWWTTAQHLEQVPRNYEDQVEVFRETFYDACKIRMRSDVPIGTALSGGLDSSSILCTMCDIGQRSKNVERMASDWQKAFVLVYANTDNDERHYAESVVSHTGVTPHFVEIKPQLVTPENLEKAIFSFEAIQNAEPSLGPWLIYQEMRRVGVTVSIDGLGGDETLVGYREYLPIAMKDSIWPIPNPSRWSELKAIMTTFNDEETSNDLRSISPTVGDVIKSLLPSFSGGKEELINGLKKIPGLYSRVRACYQFLKNINRKEQSWLQIEADRPTSRFRSIDTYGSDYLGQYLYDDFHYGSNARILRNFDRMSMAHGIESRAPFMDWRLVCLCLSLPATSKLGHGFTKRILRDSMIGVLPESIRHRKSKLGFASPMVDWYRAGLQTYVLDTLNSQGFIESPIWNGILIRNFTESCYKKQDYEGAVKSWKYIQAFSLMNSFYQAASDGGSR